MKISSPPLNIDCKKYSKYLKKKGKKPTLLELRKNLQNYHFIWIQGALTQSMKNGAASKITSTA